MIYDTGFRSPKLGPYVTAGVDLAPGFKNQIAL